MRKGGVESVHTDCKILLFFPESTNIFPPSTLVLMQMDQPRRLTFVPSWDSEVQEDTKALQPVLLQPDNWLVLCGLCWFFMSDLRAALELSRWEIVGGHCALSELFVWPASICFFLEDYKEPWKGIQ